MAPLAMSQTVASPVVAGQARPAARPAVRMPAFMPKRTMVARRAAFVTRAAAEEAAPAEEAPAAEEAAPAAEEKKEKKAEEKKTLADFEVGQIISGTVAGVQSYGAFIEIGAESQGLVHISQLKKGYVEDVKEVVSSGQAVQVKVMSIDQDKGRIALTMILEDQPEGKKGGNKRGGKREPQTPIEFPFAAGDEVQGTVKRVAGFGVFVEVAEGIEGLLHSSEMVVEDSAEDDGFDTNVRGLYKEGDTITGLFIKEIADNKVSLTEKSDDQKDWEAQLASKGAIAGLGDVKKSMASALGMAGLNRDAFPDA